MEISLSSGGVAFFVFRVLRDFAAGFFFSAGAGGSAAAFGVSSGCSAAGSAAVSFSCGAAGVSAGRKTPLSVGRN